MKFPYILSLTILLVSCAKNNTDDPLPNDPGIRLKKFIVSSQGSHSSDIFGFDYDANNRVSKFSVYKDDSTTNPAAVVTASYFTFQYNGNVTFPAKAVITHEPGNAQVDSAFYMYDAQSRIIQEDFYNGATQAVTRRRNYAYNTPWVMQTHFERNTSGSLIPKSTDSLLYHSSGNLEEDDYRDLVSGYYNKKVYLYEPDNSINPFSSINIVKHLFSVHALGNAFELLRGADNYTRSDSYAASGNRQSTHFLRYTYNPNRLPVIATDSLAVYGIPNTVELSHYRYQY